MGNESNIHAESVQITDLLASFHLRRTKLINLCKSLSLVSLDDKSSEPRLQAIVLRNPPSRSRIAISGDGRLRVNPSLIQHHRVALGYGVPKPGCARVNGRWCSHVQGPARFTT